MKAFSDIHQTFVAGGQFKNVILVMPFASNYARGTPVMNMRFFTLFFAEIHAFYKAMITIIVNSLNSITFL